MDTGDRRGKKRLFRMDPTKVIEQDTAWRDIFFLLSGYVNMVTRTTVCTYEKGHCRFVLMIKQLDVLYKKYGKKQLQEYVELINTIHTDYYVHK